MDELFVEYKKIIFKYLEKFKLIKRENIQEDGSTKDLVVEITAMGKTVGGVISAIIILFMYSLGYSFLYGYYFGKNSNTAIIDIGISSVPINYKLVITIGIVILCTAWVFVYPLLKLLKPKILFKEKLKWLIITLTMAVIVLMSLQMLLSGTYENINVSILGIIFSFPLFVILEVVIGIYIINNRERILLEVIELGILNCIYIITYMDSKIITKIIYALIFSFIERVIFIILYLLFFTISLENMERTTKIKISMVLTIFSMIVIDFKYISFIKSICILFFIINTGINDFILNKIHVIISKDKNKIGNTSLGVIDLIFGLIYTIMMVLLVVYVFFILGSDMGKKCSNFGTEVITYVINNSEETSIGKLVAYKDGNYYYSTYPERRLLIVKSTQVTSDEIINNGIKNDWLDIKNDRYFYDSKGTLKYNSWIYYEGNWYYFKKNCKMVKSEWYMLNNEWYYFNDDGTMAVDTYIDEYYVDSNGKYMSK